MKYYKVKPQYDGKSKRSRGYEDGIYIANELYTEREVQRQNLNRTFLEEKEISSKTTEKSSLSINASYSILRLSLLIFLFRL